MSIAIQDAVFAVAVLAALIHGLLPRNASATPVRSDKCSDTGVACFKEMA